MKNFLKIAAISIFLLSCADAERDNPNDGRAANYSKPAEPSSSSSDIALSSSSEEPSSSSVEANNSSSSSDIASSSSSEELSSSSESPSSSSAANCLDFNPDAKVEHHNKMKNQICDVRDNKRYVYVDINGQTWMAENLNYDADGSKCYNDSLENCAKYGRLYDWATAMGFPSNCNLGNCPNLMQEKNRGICPDGWYIPNNMDWQYIRNVNGLKAPNIPNWSNNNGESGFSALPGGYGRNNNFFEKEQSTRWWNSNDENYPYAHYEFMQQQSGIINSSSGEKSDLLSVRCFRGRDY